MTGLLSILPHIITILCFMLLNRGSIERLRKSFK